MEQEETSQTLHPEAVAAYNDQKVIEALRRSDWFTADFIGEVQKNEPNPEREGLGPFKDKLLGDFFTARTHLGKENQVYKGIQNYLHKRMVGSQGHPLPLKDIEFTNSELLDFARNMGVNGHHKVDRDFIGRVESMLQCLIAPEAIRKKVIRIRCGWGVERIKRDTLLWAELVRKGTKSYLQSREL
jgi:hypothetical protein